jgi:hypothetical protein
MSARHSSTDWNPRYVSYANACGHTPEEQLEEDRRRWPGGVNAGFMIWIDQGMLAFLELRKDVDRDVMSEKDHADFSTFLSQWKVCTCS